MKKEVIMSAKTVEEAVALAVKELGAPSADAIEYTLSRYGDIYSLVALHIPACAVKALPLKESVYVLP